MFEIEFDEATGVSGNKNTGKNNNNNTKGKGNDQSLLLSISLSLSLFLLPFFFGSKKDYCHLEGEQPNKAKVMLTTTT